jgi:hypothetical protein
MLHPLATFTDSGEVVEADAVDWLTAEDEDDADEPPLGSQDMPQVG